MTRADMNRFSGVACAWALMTTVAFAQAPGGKAPSADLPPLPKANASAYVIQHAKIVTLAGAPIERGSIVIERGRITAVGANVTVPAGAEIIEGEGLQVYPGLFDSVTHLGMTEIDSISATNDFTEIGELNPQLVAASAVNPVTDHIPITRANGITHAVAVPNGGTISGQASAINLDGWTIEEMSLKSSVAMAITWPSLSPAAGGGAGFGRRPRPYSEIKQEYETKVRELGELFDRARQYQQATEHPTNGGPARDLKLEALLPVLRGEQLVLVTADAERDIRHAIEFCDQRTLKMILAGGAQSYRLVDLLAQKKIPVILGPTQKLPLDEDEPYDVRNTTPGVLQKAGIPFALATFDSADSRNLPYEIGNAVSYGLPRDEALKAITVNPARILGLDKEVGTLEAGKLANLIVTTGDPLEIQTQVRYLFIKGQPTSLDTRQLNLYEKWRGRPRPATPSLAPKPPTTASR